MLAQLELEGGQLSGSLDGREGRHGECAERGGDTASAQRETIANSGLISVENGATLTLSGTVRNSGTLFAAGGTLDIAGVVSGGTTLISNGTVDIQQASADNVTFQLGGTGGLELDVASAYSANIAKLPGLLKPSVGRPAENLASRRVHEMAFLAGT